LPLYIGVEGCGVAESEVVACEVAAYAVAVCELAESALAGSELEESALVESVLAEWLVWGCRSWANAQLSQEGHRRMSRGKATRAANSVANEDPEDRGIVLIACSAGSRNAARSLGRVNSEPARKAGVGSIAATSVAASGTSGAFATLAWASPWAFASADAGAGADAKPEAAAAVVEVAPS